MKTYLFETVTTTRGDTNYWIDRNYISDLVVEAKTVNDALIAYKKRIEDFVQISDNALKNKSEMYIDDKQGNSKQTGFVIIAKTDFYDDTKRKHCDQYIDLWISINVISSAF